MPSWTLLSFAVLIIVVALDLMYMYLMKQKYSSLEIVLYGIVPAAIVGILYTTLTKQQINAPKHWVDGCVFAIVGFSFFFAFLLQRIAQHKSPNVGYVNAIVYSSVLISVLVSALIFQDRLSPSAFVGCIFVVLGLIMITTSK
jgi:drug/metabolite transporter (DMT)-like permease